MVMRATRYIGLFCLLWTLTSAEDFSRNPGKSNHESDSIQPRFLPFSASFSLSSGGFANNAHSLSVGGGTEGVSFSQSTSQSGTSLINEGAGISASQSSSFAAGLSGISGSESNSFNLQHPVFSGGSEANSNSFALGQASSSAHGNVVNGQASSGAQSSVGTLHSSASSGAASSAGISNLRPEQDFRRGQQGWTNVAPNRQIGGVYTPNGGKRRLHVTQGSRGWRVPTKRPITLSVNLDENRWQQPRPEVVITSYRGTRQGATADSQKNCFDEESWTQSPLTGPNAGTWSQQSPPVVNDQGIRVSGVSASSSASSSSSGSLAQSHSFSQSNFGPNGPNSSTSNGARTSGRADAQAQAGAAAIGQNSAGNAQGSFSSGTIAAGGSQANGNSFGTAISGNQGQSNRGQITGHASGVSFAQGTASAGTLDVVRFPDSDNAGYAVPKEFVRIDSSGNERWKSRARNPVGEILTDITDTVADLFDI